MEWEVNLKIPSARKIQLRLINFSVTKFSSKCDIWLLCLQNVAMNFGALGYDTGLNLRKHILYEHISMHNLHVKTWICFIPFVSAAQGSAYLINTLLHLRSHSICDSCISLIILVYDFDRYSSQNILTERLYKNKYSEKYCIAGCDKLNVINMLYRLFKVPTLKFRKFLFSFLLFNLTTNVTIDVLIWRETDKKLS